MKESYDEGIATHIGLESCAAVCEGGSEALTKERAGRVYSRENKSLWGADAVGESGRSHRVHRKGEVYWNPTRSETPSTYGNTSHENRESPCPPETKGVAGRIGKSKDKRR